MTDLEALAVRCEQATGPDRHLDIAINKALRGSGNPAWVLYINPPKFSASIDAAMMLVPQGADWMLDNFDGPHGRRCSGSVFPERQVKNEGEAFASTPALALCAAALRGRIQAEVQGKAS